MARGRSSDLSVLDFRPMSPVDPTYGYFCPTYMAVLVIGRPTVSRFAEFCLLRRDQFRWPETWLSKKLRGAI